MRYINKLLIYKGYHKFYVILFKPHLASKPFNLHKIDEIPFYI